MVWVVSDDGKTLYCVPLKYLVVVAYCRLINFCRAEGRDVIVGCGRSGGIYIVDTVRCLFTNIIGVAFALDRGAGDGLRGIGVGVGSSVISKRMSISTGYGNGNGIGIRIGIDTGVGIDVGVGVIVIIARLHGRRNAIQECYGRRGHFFSGRDIFIVAVVLSPLRSLRWLMAIVAKKLAAPSRCSQSVAIEGT